MASLLVISTNFQRAAQTLALPNLGVGELVDLVRFQAFLGRRRAVSPGLVHLLTELIAQRVAPAVDLVFFDSVARNVLVSTFWRSLSPSFDWFALGSISCF